MGGFYLLVGSNLKKYGKFRKTLCFSGLIWPDRGSTAWADMARLESIELIEKTEDCYLPTHQDCRLASVSSTCSPTKIFSMTSSILTRVLPWLKTEKQKYLTNK